MFLSAAALSLLTLPFCGIDAWISWFEVAHRVESGYAEVLKWEWMRRDLTGLMNQCFGPTHPLLGWIAMTAVVVVTATAWRRSASHPHHPARDALILSAIVLSCPRFMYYDIVMATPAMLVALSGWNDLAKGARIVLSALILAYFAAWPLGFGVWPWFWPVETASILGVWLWCLWQLIPCCTSAGRNPVSDGRQTPECS